MAAALCLYVALGIQMVTSQLEGKPLPMFLMEDYGCYSRALERSQFGADVYADHTAQTGYLYPPTELLLVAALDAPHSMPVKFAVFSTASLLGLFLTVALLLRETQTRREEPVAWVMLVLTFAFAPVGWSLYLGQINILIAFTVAASFLVADRHPVAAGSAIAIGTALKLTPVLLLVLFLRRKYIRVHLGFIATAGALSLATGLILGFKPFLTYVGVLKDMAQTFPHGFNGSRSFVNTLFLLGGPLGLHLDGWFRPMQSIYTGLMLTLFLGAAWLTRDGRNRHLFFSMVAIGITILPNVLWYHHFIIAFPGLLILLCSKESTTLLRRMAALSIAVAQVDFLLGNRLDKLTLIPSLLALMLVTFAVIAQRARVPAAATATATA